MIDQNTIFSIKNNSQFKELTLDIFKYQFENNTVYRSFCDLLYKHPSNIKHIEDIPFLPIQFFKSHQVISSTKTIAQIFTSSGTTGSITSKHLVADLSIYKTSFRKGFKNG